MSMKAWMVRHGVVGLMEQGVALPVDWKEPKPVELGEQVGKVMDSLVQSVPRFCKVEGIKVVPVSDQDTKRLRGWMIVCVCSGFGPWVWWVKRCAVREQEARRKAIELMSVSAASVQKVDFVKGV
jgi:hypothetical protein